MKEENIFEKITRKNLTLHSLNVIDLETNSAVGSSSTAFFTKAGKTRDSHSQYTWSKIWSIKQKSSYQKTPFWESWDTKSNE